MPIDASDRPNDRFGYSVYAVVALAPETLADAVNELRGAIGMRRAAVPAHVTVKGTFCDIDSLDAVRRRIRDVAAACAPVRIVFADPAAPTFGESWAVLDVRLTPELSALNAALESAIGPASTNAYSDAPFRPHLTLCQDCSSKQLNHAKRLAAATAFGTGFTADAVDLVGRAGPAYGGRWESIERFRLAGAR